jgi:uncharacterized protein (DUF952 family)
MAAPNPLPKYIYKIVPADPQPLPEALPLSDLDRNDGFLHLSTAAQVQLTFLFPLQQVFMLSPI